MAPHITVIEDSSSDDSNNAHSPPPSSSPSLALSNLLQTLSIPPEYSKLHSGYAGSGHGHENESSAATDQQHLDMTALLDAITSENKSSEETEAQRLEKEAQERMEKEEAVKGMEDQRKWREKVVAWRRGVGVGLRGVQGVVFGGGGDESANKDILDVEAWAGIVFGVVPFGVVIEGRVGNEPEPEPEGEDEDEAKEDEDAIRVEEAWVDQESQKIARAILSHEILSNPSQDLLQHVLGHKLKPIFRATPHPKLDIETGRRLPRPAGGYNAGQDFYEAQAWKDYPGIGEVIFWCVRHIQPEGYEKMWHLIIPPIMTLLDDFEVRNKLKGVLVVQEMLRHVPRSLLRRTGLDKMMSASLRNCLAHLDHPDSGLVIRAAVSTAVTLLLESTSVKDKKTGLHASDERFNELCDLLGDGIIAGVWVYAEDKPKVVHATLDVLPRVVKALDLGTVRFMQALIPQVTHCVIPRAFVAPNRKMEMSALRVLEAVIDVCEARMGGWVVTILDALARCWVGIVDLGSDADEDARRVKASVEGICSRLGVGSQWKTIVGRAVGNRS